LEKRATHPYVAEALPGLPADLQCGVMRINRKKNRGVFGFGDFSRMGARAIQPEVKIF
jgi:hypothetical protein